jgi:hypothetical protein
MHCAPPQCGGLVLVRHPTLVGTAHELNAKTGLGRLGSEAGYHVLFLEGSPVPEALVTGCL